MRKLYLSILSGLLLLGSCVHRSGEAADWPVYGGNKAGNRYSPLRQINLDNVSQLRVAWSYDSNDPPQGGGGAGGNSAPGKSSGASRRRIPGEIQCQPIVVHGILYGTTANLKLFALDAATGRELWKFDPFRDTVRSYHQNRGVAYWESGEDRRILYTAGPNLYAVDANTGKGIDSFGWHGRVNLHDGLSLNFDASKLFVDATSPGVIYKNSLILGNTVSEAGDAAPGYVRAYDVLSGKILWVFHTMPQPGEFGYTTWPVDAYKKIGATNNWSGLTLDEKRGTVYFGTGSPASDFYGAERDGINLFSDCIMALDAGTGNVKWYYQTIHHDLWDRDIPSPPNLVTVQHDGRRVDAVVTATKDGCVYVLDRDSGVSLFPVEERPVPTHGLPGEHPWPTQKYPVKPLPFAAQEITDSDITNISPQSHEYVKGLFAQFDHGNKFIPPGTRGSLLVGYSGGAEWGGNAIDSEGVLYQNSNNAIWELQMESMADLRREIASLSVGRGLYVENCSSCHGLDRKGNGKEIPSLMHIGDRLKTGELAVILKTGQGRMPSFIRLAEEDRMAIINYLEDRNGHSRVEAEHAVQRKGVMQEKPMQEKDTVANVRKAPDFPYVPEYVGRVWEKLTDQDGYPAIKPPWGTLNAIDLNTGDYLWRVPLGEYPELTKKGVPVTGTESYGGPLATAGGLVFIAGTRDGKIRAFVKRTGKIVWEYQLPAGGFATPITYECDGRQYVVIAAGGGRGLPAGGKYIAFALP
ncbi:MAG TPA: PQQ-binding-like beta-propeller repeat protein [Puia sp.]